MAVEDGPRHTLQMDRGRPEAEQQLASPMSSPVLPSEFFVSDEHPMYVQRWGPTTSALRVVLIHGGVHTGVCWTSRPDGQPGWAQHLAEQGWSAFVVDWPGVG